MITTDRQFAIVAELPFKKILLHKEWLADSITFRLRDTEIDRKTVDAVMDTLCEIMAEYHNA